MQYFCLLCFNNVTTILQLISLHEKDELLLGTTDLNMSYVEDSGERKCMKVALSSGQFCGGWLKWEDEPDRSKWTVGIN